MQEEIIRDKVENFIDKHSGLILLAILALALFLRFKYITINSAVWWDEADYLTLAKHFGLGLPEQAAPWRARPIPMLWGIFYYLGGTEYTIRFLNQLISVAGVYLAYLVSKEFFSKKIALFSAFFMAVYHEGLFWSARVSMDLYAVIMWLLIMLFFYRGYIKNQDKKYLYATGALFGFGIYAYDSIGFFAVAVFFYLIVTERLSFLKNKKFWLIALAAIIAFIPFAAYHKIEFDAIYPRISNMIGPQVVSGNEVNRPLSANLQEYFSFFTAFPYYLLSTKLPYVLFFLFLFGLIMHSEFFLGFDLLLKNNDNNENLKRDYYVFLVAFALPFMFGFVVMLSNFYFEARYLLPLMPIYLSFAGNGLFKAQEYVSKYNYLISWALVLVVIYLSASSQLAYADNLIQFKKDTYVQEKFGGEWIRQNTNKNDILVGCGQTVQILYYSERPFYYTVNARLEEIIREKKPKYYVLDFMDPSCANERYPIENPDKMRLVNIFFYDQEQKQPVYLVFEVNQSAYS